MTNYKFNIYKIRETNPEQKYTSKELEQLKSNKERIIYKYSLYYNLEYNTIMYYNSTVKGYSKYYNKRAIKNEFLKNESDNICSSIRAFIKVNFKNLNKNNLIRIDNNYFLITKEIFL